MQPNSEENATFEEGVESLRRLLTLIAQYIERGGDTEAPPEVEREADAYLELSNRIFAILNREDDDVEQSPFASARSRMRWAAAADFLAYKAFALAELANLTEGEAAQSLLDELANAQLLTRDVLDYVEAGSTQRAIYQAARGALDNDLPLIETGLRGLPVPTGGAGSTNPLGVANDVIDEILSEVSDAVPKAFGSTITNALLGPRGLGLLTQALGYLRTSNNDAVVGGVFARKAGQALKNALTKLRTMADGTWIEQFATWLDAHFRDLVSGQIVQTFVDFVYQRDQLETRCRVLAAKIPNTPRDQGQAVAGLSSVDFSFKQWSRWDHLVAGCVRFVIRPFSANAVVFALLIASGFAETGVIAYAAWDHLDSPNIGLHSFEKSVIDVLQ
jgi:hypothetical protein